MSFSETIFLFVLALVIFGPKKLPEIARYVGKTLAEFRRASNEFKAQIEQEIAHLEVEKEKQKQTILPPSPTPEGTTSRTLSAASSEGSSPTPGDSATPAEAPATLAASTEESATPQHVSEPATEALPPAEAVTSSTSQESHA